MKGSPRPVESPRDEWSKATENGIYLPQEIVRVVDRVEPVERLSLTTEALELRDRQLTVERVTDELRRHF
jgi:hypothetical protein